MKESEAKHSFSDDTLDFILEYIKDAPEYQLSDADMLDNKAIQILSVASIVIGLLGLVTGRIKLCNSVAIMLLILAIAAYILVVVFVIMELRAAWFRRTNHADTLWKEHWDDSVNNIKHDLVSDISEAYAYNKVVLNNKANSLQRALIAMGFEVVAVGIFIVIFLMVV